MAEIYYKTAKTSKYGKKFQALIDLGKSVETQILEFMIEIDAEPPYLKRGGHIFHTGVFAAKFSQEPDLKVWKKVPGFPDYYQPRMSSKIGKELELKFDAFPKIEEEEIGKIFGYDEFLHRPGYNIGKEFFGIVMLSEWKHTMPKEFKEITFSEYGKL